MYKLSNLAAEDFGSIYEYTYRQFGCEQADKYTHELNHFLSLLAKNPQAGRDISDIINGVRRHDYRLHAIFYRQSGCGIFIIRILHQKMNPFLHLSE
jgi:toxin ParE1/3/4